MDEQVHWDRIYDTRDPEQLSWYQPHLRISLDLIAATGLGQDASIIDIGAGAGTLTGDLLARGYQHVTALDLSAAGLAHAQTRLGDQAAAVTWLVGDVTAMQLPTQAYDLWHDRAVFHFLVPLPARAAYRQAVQRALRPGGHLIIATFDLDGPPRCSGLDVVRYSPDMLAAQFGDAFELVESRCEAHITPGGTTQQFQFSWLRYRTPVENSANPVYS